MFATSRFVFIHHFRHGGTFVNALLRRSFRGTELGYHRFRAATPPAYRALPVIGVVRNPWDFYVSAYHHAVNFNYPHGAGTAWNFITGSPALRFREALRALFEIRDASDEQRRTIAARFPPAYDWTARFLDNITGADFLDYAAGDVGWHTWLFRRMFARNGTFDDVHFGRQERLRADIVRILADVGAPIDPAAFAAEPRANATFGTNTFIGELPVPRKRDYRLYYDDELAQRVADEDRVLIDAFGYAF